MEVPHNEDNLYHVELSISEGSMDVKINGSEIGTVPGPGFDLGTIGVYKHRGVSGAYIDDILIKQGGDIIAADDFDGNFLYSHILGIKPDENAPGYEHFYVKPVIMEGLDAVSGSIETRYGTISVSYDKNSGTMKVAVPKDTTSTLTLPSGEERELKSGEQEFKF